MYVAHPSSKGLCPYMQASTLDGVLELKNEHFWSIAFGVFVSAPPPVYPLHNALAFPYVPN